MAKYKIGKTVYKLYENIFKEKCVTAYKIRYVTKNDDGEFMYGNGRTRIRESELYPTQEEALLALEKLGLE